MRRDDATNLAYQLLREHGLTDWKVRLTTQMAFLGRCHHDSKSILLNNHQIDTHPDIEIEHIIRHEIAHALTPGHGHDEVWAEMARRIGCTNTTLCGPPLDARAIDAIRSGAIVEVEYDEEIIRKPKYKITRLQEKCKECGKVAKEITRTQIGDIIAIRLECNHLIMKEVPKATPFHEMLSLDAESNCKHEWNHNRCIHCPAAKLFDYQVKGARFLESAYGRAGIFDEQGLGKTVQALAYLRYHPEAFPVLFIVKSSIKYQWLSEIFRWLGDSYFAQIINTSKEHPIKGLKCYIISYDLLRRYDLNLFKTAGIKTVIVDECQQIKNADSTRTQMVRNVVREVTGFIPLSGTPWKNRGSEYFPVLNMLDSVRFNSNERFITQWVDFYYEGAKLKQGGIKDVAKFREYVKDIVIRRERKEVDVEFPDLNRVKFVTELDELQREVYDQEESEFVKWWNTLVLGGDEDKAFMPGEDNALAKLTRLRHMVGLNKIPATIELAEEFIENTTDRKLVILVHHIDVGKIIAKKLRENETTSRVPIFTLTADLNGAQRFDLQDKFNQTQRCIMVASTLAAGEGMNLQTCSDCIIHERQWNPANEEQVEGRFIRIGATANKVNSTYAHAENSIDTKFDAIVEQKRIQFHNSMNNGEMMQWSQESLVKQLVQSIVDGYNQRMKSSVRK